MHNYNKVEKEIIDLLRDQDVRDIKLLGNTIQKAFFRAEKTAMLVDCANHKAKLFYPLRTPYNHEDRKEFAQLVSLLNFIDVLEQKGLIYLQPMLDVNCSFTRISNIAFFMVFKRMIM